MLEHSPIRYRAFNKKLLNNLIQNKSMKNLINVERNSLYALKFDLKMKLTIYLFLVSLFQIQASTYSQNTKISLELEKVSIEKVLREIESKTEFNFLYKDKQLDYKKIVSVSYKNATISKILENLFKNTKINSEVLDKQIVLVVNKNKTTTPSKLVAVVEQQKTITGTVNDDSGLPLPGASVLVKGSNSGATTDFDGNFSLTVKGSAAILVVSYIGFETKNVTIGNKSTFKISLAPSAATLDEVVVIGYGTSSRKDLTGSVSQVSSKSFEDQPLSRIEDALQGRASGVTVAKTSGAPGAAAKIRIRGANSITGNNDPLVVVDGVIGGDLSTINPNDIASMDILKDASATAVYGSRGSNGVIMITTKKGSGKSKINIDYFSTIAKVPEFLSQLGVVDFATIENARRVRVGSSPNFTTTEIDDLKTNGGTNYQDEIFKTAISNTLQISASGSEGKLRYFISGNYTDQEGIVINTGYNRLAMRANVESKISDKLKVSLNLYGSKSSTKNDLDTFGRFQGTPIMKALTWDPTTPIYDSNGLYNLRSVKGIGSLNDNPLFVLNESDFRRFNNRFNATFNLSYKITDGLTYNMIAGSTQSNTANQNYTVETGDDYLPDVSYSGVDRGTQQLSNVITWQKEIGEHRVKVTGLYEFSTYENRVNGYNANGLALPLGYYKADDWAPASGKNINNSFNEGSIESYMIRGEYGWNDDLLVTATVRRDGSSIFQNNKWGTYPSVALAYTLDDEVEDIDAISSLKFRLGYGQVGNANLAAYSSFGLLTTNQYAFDGANPQTGTVISSFNNSDLTWETTTQFNGGIDFGILDNKVNISIDAYKKVTTDLLLEVPVSDTNGGNNGAISIFSNVGEVENKGVDVSISSNIIESQDFTWNANFNISFMKNEVTNLYGDITQYDGSFQAPGGQARSVNMISEGKSLGEFLGATFVGTWKTAEATEAAVFGKIPGDAKYLRDENDEIVFGSIGNGTPTMQWGLNNTFTYKNWDLNVFLQGVHGFEVYNIVQAAITGGAGDARSFLAASQVNQWSATNETEIPAGTTFYNSSRYVEKGDFIRLSNLNVGYTLNDFLGMDSFKIYAGGQNLFLITDYTGYDPEHTSRSADGSGNTDVAAGINTGAYPNPRTYNIGVKVSF
jgi:TonB-linked SusC/RagA family outer membrane protein